MWKKKKLCTQTWKDKINVVGMDRSTILLGFKIVKIIVRWKPYLEEAKAPSALEPYYPNGGSRTRDTSIT